MLSCNSISPQPCSLRQRLLLDATCWAVLLPKISVAILGIFTADVNGMQRVPLIFKNYFWNVDLRKEQSEWLEIDIQFSTWNKRERWRVAGKETRRGGVSYYNNVIPAASPGDHILLKSIGTEIFEIYCS